MSNTKQIKVGRTLELADGRSVEVRKIHKTAGGIRIANLWCVATRQMIVKPVGAVKVAA